MNNNVGMTKPCKHCQNQIPVKANKCMYCGKSQGLPGWAIALIVVGVILVLAAAGGSSDSDTDKKTNEASNVTATNKKENKNDYTLGETLKFDDLEFTFGTKIEFTKVNNEFSDHHKKTVVKIPVKVKNIGKENNDLNIWDFKVFGSKGTELDDISAYFSDKGAVQYAGELRPSASYNKFAYFLYDGDGEYQIEFDELLGETKTVTFNIKK